MLYRILKFFIGIGIRLFYSEVKIKNYKNLPQKGPLIIIVNHPNTLMDAWVIGMICKQPIYYMAKATLFKTKFRLRILKSLNMVPINRQGEGIIDGVDNVDSLEACYHILEAGKSLMIFPEGTSYQERVLRKLKTGTARIALESEQRNKGKLGLKVVAVGLNYSQPEKFRSKIFIDIDTPRGVTEFLEEYQKDSIVAAKKLTTQFRTRMEKVLLTTETKEEDQLIEDIAKVLKSKYTQKSEKGVSNEVKSLKEIKDKIDELKLFQPWLITEIHTKVRAINWKLEKLKIKTDFLDKKFRSSLVIRQFLSSVLFVLLGLPLFVFGFIHNFFQYKITDYIIPKLSTDIEYYAPFAVFLGLFFYPVIYSLFLLMGYFVFDFNWWMLVIYLLIMPLSGFFAYWFVRYMQHISYKWQYIFLMADRKSLLKDLQHEKNELRKMILTE
jgi:1-acyl-sn-glycerol-3-phosphate acyltransferase